MFERPLELQNRGSPRINPPSKQEKNKTDTEDKINLGTGGDGEGSRVSGRRRDGVLYAKC